MSKVVVTYSHQAKGKKKQLQYAQVASEQLKWFIFVTASRFQMILVQKEEITKKYANKLSIVYKGRSFFVCVFL